MLTKILFFSRGRGRGHAIPDMQIAKELERQDSEIEIRFVSYGTGAIMAVPAHDERDLEFAQKFELNVRTVVQAPDGAESVGLVVLYSFGLDVAQMAPLKERRQLPVDDALISYVRALRLVGL